MLVIRNLNLLSVQSWIMQFQLSNSYRFTGARLPAVIIHQILPFVSEYALAQQNWRISEKFYSNFNTARQQILPFVSEYALAQQNWRISEKFYSNFNTARQRCDKDMTDNKHKGLHLA